MRITKLIFTCNIILVLLLTGCQKPKTQKVSRITTQTKISLEQLEKKEIMSLLEELKQKNPFRSDHASGIISAPQAGTNLKGIIWDNQRPFALIGNSVVAEGDSVDGKRVIKINKDSVILDNQGEREILKLEDIYK